MAHSISARMHRAIRAFARDGSGAIAPVAAVFLVLALAVSAVAVDLGYLWHARRATQSAADLAAIAAIRASANSQQAAEATVSGNGITGTRTVRLEWGRYASDKAVAPRDRFTPVFGAAAGTTDAVRVTVRRAAPVFFAAMFIADRDMEIAAQATATHQATAGISIGSALFSLDGGIVNTLLSGLTGSNISLSAMHYAALAHARIDLLSTLGALGTDLNLQAATYDELLGAEVSAAQLVHAMAAASHSNAVQAALAALGGQMNGGTSLRLATILDLGTLGGAAVGQGSQVLDVHVLDLLQNALTAADGDHQVAFNLGADVPGLAGTKVVVAIGERPQEHHWISYGPEGVTVRTAQMRLKIDTTVSGGEAAVSGVLKSLLGPLTPVSVEPVRLPVYVELAASEATIGRIACDADGHSSTVGVVGRTGLAKAWIGDVDKAAMANFAAHPSVAPGRIAAIKVLGQPIGVAASAEVVVGSPAERTVTFSATEVGGNPRTIVSNGLASSTIGSLLADTELDIEPLGAPLFAVLQPLKAGILKALAPAAKPVDGLVDGVLAALGIGLGYADIRLLSVGCATTRLVM